MEARAWHILTRLILICAAVEWTLAASPYSMYVWTDGFDVDVPGCAAVFPLWDKTNYPQCFTHTWETTVKRQWLWDTIELEGRYIDTLYVSDMHHRLRDAYDADNCNSPGLDPLRALLASAACRDVQIYALFAVSDQPVSEQGLVKYVVWYNDQCAECQPKNKKKKKKNNKKCQAKFTGVAVNNEAFAGLKCNGEAAQVQHLTDLAGIASEAAKQVNGILRTHFSLSWHWGRCSSTLDNMLTWGGKVAKATDHMIDIFDSTDVQVAWTRADTIVKRLIVAGINYAKSLNKAMYVTVYTNKGPDCRTTFFPQPCGTFSYNPSQAGMFAVFDDVEMDPDGQYAHPCIHYFRGIYGSGGHVDWPRN